MFPLTGVASQSTTKYEAIDASSTRPTARPPEGSAAAALGSKWAASTLEISSKQKSMNTPEAAIGEIPNVLAAAAGTTFRY